MNQTTAIILFARTVKSESKEKSLLLTNGKGNRNAIHLLRNHAIEVIKATKLPYFIFSEEEQIGSCFAEKITNAYVQTFAMGYENIIAIGADIPSIVSQDIIVANQILEKSSSVCGPTHCGGSYLLGINKTAFKKEKFLTLAWQTADLFNDIVNNFEGCIALKELPELNNADQLSTLHFSASSNSSSFVKSFLQLIHSIIINPLAAFHTSAIPTTFCNVQWSGRAP